MFDRLLITVHPAGCFAARTFIERYLQDAMQSEVLSASARSRLPSSAADLMLRMLNLVVDSYLELRKALSGELDQWQQTLLAPHRHADADWAALMTARNALHMLQDLCEEQNDAMQEWLDAQREQPPPGCRRRSGTRRRGPATWWSTSSASRTTCTAWNRVPRRPCRSTFPRSATAPTTSCAR